MAQIDSSAYESRHNHRHTSRGTNQLAYNSRHKSRCKSIDIQLEAVFILVEQSAFNSRQSLYKSRHKSTRCTSRGRSRSVNSRRFSVMVCTIAGSHSPCHVIITRVEPSRVSREDQKTIAVANSSKPSIVGRENQLQAKHCHQKKTRCIVSNMNAQIRRTTNIYSSMYNSFRL